jgi:hypothetical protein
VRRFRDYGKSVKWLRLLRRVIWNLTTKKIEIDSSITDLADFFAKGAELIIKF